MSDSSGVPTPSWVDYESSNDSQPNKGKRGKSGGAAASRKAEGQRSIPHEYQANFESFEMQHERVHPQAFRVEDPHFPLPVAPSGVQFGPNDFDYYQEHDFGAQGSPNWYQQEREGQHYEAWGSQDPNLNVTAAGSFVGSMDGNMDVQHHLSDDLYSIQPYSRYEGQYFGPRESPRAEETVPVPNFIRPLSRASAGSNTSSEAGGGPQSSKAAAEPKMDLVKFAFDSTVVYESGLGHQRRQSTEKSPERKSNSFE